MTDPRDYLDDGWDEEMDKREAREARFDAIKKDRGLNLEK